MDSENVEFNLSNYGPCQGFARNNKLIEKAPIPNNKELIYFKNNKKILK